jgi:ABC-2 type transport system permease protein
VNNFFEAAWVIARRDFMATVYSRAFIIFMLAPVLLMAISIFASQAMGRADREAQRSSVALLTDGPTAQALQKARAELAAGTSEFAFPVVRHVESTENVEGQARELISQEEGSYSGVLMGTLERPVLVGPPSAERAFGSELKLMIERARTAQTLATSGSQPAQVALERVETEQSAGSLRNARYTMARVAHILIFTVTLMLATMLVSNFVEEKTSKIIEVLAAAVPLDSIFLGKLLATLAISLVGIALWGGMIVLAYLFIQTVQNWVSVPTEPAIGWLAFAPLLLIYYMMNFMLLGTVFLGIGSQASSVKEVQTISMPLVLAQLAMVALAGMAISGDGGFWMWAAYIFPLSSPMAMIAYAIQSDQIWPHFVALGWQAFWVVLFIRFASTMFRQRVMKSGGKAQLFPRLRPRQG